MFWRAAQNSAKMRGGALARALRARASVDFSRVLCSPPVHRLQNKNRDFKRKTIDFLLSFGPCRLSQGLDGRVHCHRPAREAHTEGTENIRRDDFRPLVQ